MYACRNIFAAGIVLTASKSILLGVALSCLAADASQMAVAQKAPAAASVPDFAPAMIEHMHKMRRYRDPDRGTQHTPPIIEQFDIDQDPSGAVASFQPNGATVTSKNAFFQNLGENGRTCFTCHQPQSGWSVIPGDIAVRFDRSAGADPIFRLVDGATCPSADVSTLRAKRRAYKLLIDKGLIRIGLAIPAVTEFAVVAVDDPYGCNSDPATGIISPTSGILSTYRRPLPSTNIGFLSAIMWDGREADLNNQAVDATLGHAQASTPPTPDQVAQIVAFQRGIFTAQVFDKKAKFLTDDNARGGPVALSLELANFFIGVNDPLGNNPKGIPFTSQIFDLYRPWLSSGERQDYGNRPPAMSSIDLLKKINITDAWRFNEHERNQVSDHRRSIARGEEVFNTIPISIRGVSGLNDELKVDSIPGFCGTCHDAPNVGNHSVKAPLDIGIADAGDKQPPVLDISGLPVFTVKCTQGPLEGQMYKVTDLGRAMISGKCKDIGRFKGPILRGLAARAPYFHNGSAETLRDVVNFYDQRFEIGLTHKQKVDLVNFLKTL